KLLALNILGHRRRSLFLGAVGRRDRAGDDHRQIKITRDVFLVAIETLRPTFATVPHLGVLYRYAAVRSNALPNANGPALVDFQVLVSNLCDGIEIWAKGLLDDVVQVAVHPLLQRRHLPLYD